LQVFKDPSILKLQRFETVELDMEDGKPKFQVSVADMAKAFREHQSLLVFLDDWETRAVTLTLREYQRLPAPVNDCRRVFRKVLRKKD